MLTTGVRKKKKKKKKNEKLLFGRPHRRAAETAAAVRVSWRGGVSVRPWLLSTSTFLPNVFILFQKGSYIFITVEAKNKKGSISNV
jgi:hypothetical protein